MANPNWIGNAQARADEWWFRPANVEATSLYSLTINAKTITVHAGAADSSGEATDVSPSGVVALMQEAIRNSPLPEWREVSVDSGSITTAFGFVPETEGGGVLRLKGPANGRPIIITGATSTDASKEDSVLVYEVTKGVTGRNEKQSISFSTTPAGGTFTLSFAGYTTGDIDYNATAEAVQAELESLASVGVGNCVVTGSAGSWDIEFTGTRAQTNVPLISGDGTGLTGSGSVTVTTLIDGTNETAVIFDYQLNMDNNYSYPKYPYEDPGALPASITRHAFAIDSGGPFLPFGYQNAPFYPNTWILGDQDGVSGAFRPIDVFRFYRSRSMEAGGVWLSNVNSLYGITGGNTMVVRAKFSILDSPPPLSIVIVHQMESALGYGGTNIWSNAATGALPIRVISDGSGVNEIQRIVVAKSTGGTFTLTFQGQTTGAITYSPTGATLAANIQAALEDLPNIAPGDVVVEFTGSVANALVFTATFGGAYEFVDVEQMTADASGLAGGYDIVVRTTQTAVVDVNEVQGIAILNNPAGGTFRLSFGGYTTTALAYNASAATVQAALEALTSIGAGNIIVSGSDGGPWSCTFVGTLAAADQPSMSGNGLALILIGNQSMEISRAYAIKYTVGGWDATTHVYTPRDGNPVIDGVEVGDYASVYDYGLIGGAAYLARVTARDDTTITLSADAQEGAAPESGPHKTLLIVTAPTGPNYWDNVDNWSTGELPADGDTITIENSTVGIQYHINQSLITPAAILIPASFQAHIGLPEYASSGYREYRTTTLRLGNAADAQAITIDIGRGAGAGSPLLRLDTGDAETVIDISRSASSAQGNYPAILWKGTHASNTVRVQRGSFGAAVFAGEVATISTLTIDWLDDQSRSSSVMIGPGVTLTTITKTGGELVTYAGFESLTQAAGETTIHMGAAGTVTLFGGRYTHNSSGTITTLTVYDAYADFAQSSVPITVTNTTLYKGASLDDDNQRITFTNPYVVQGRLALLNLGVSYTGQRS